MKLRELAEKYNLDLTELSCAISVVVGQELTGDDEIELTPEVVAGIKDFLGVEIEPEGGESAQPEEEGEEAKEDKGGEDKLAREGGTAEEGSGPEVEEEGEQEEKQDEGKKEEKGPEGVLEDEGQSDKEEEIPEAEGEVSEGEAEAEPESGEGREEIEGTKEVKEEGGGEGKDEEVGTAEDVGEVQGSPHQEAAGDSSTKGGEEETAQEEIVGGEEVPEGVGDERALLLGEGPAPSTSSEKGQVSEEKISIDEVQIKEEVVDTNKDIEVPQDVPSTEITESAVPVETVQDVSSQESSPAETRTVPAFPPILAYGIFALSLLSFVLVAIGVIRLLSASKKDRVPTESRQFAGYSDSDLFALMYRMVEKENYATAEDLFQELKTRFPNSKFLDDASIVLGDAFFDKRADLPEEERYAKAIEYYRFAYENSPRMLNKEKALLRIAHSAYRMGDYSTAIKHYKEFLERFSFSNMVDEARYYLALSYKRSGDDGSAEKELWRLVKEQTKSPYRPLALYELVRWYSEDKRWDKIIETAPLFIEDYKKDPHLSEVLFRYADALIESGQIDKAISVYTEAEQDLPKDLLPELLLRKGRAYELKGDIDSAIETYIDLATRFKYDELSAQALYDAARLLAFEKRDFKRAERLLYDLKERFYKWEKLPSALFLLSQTLAHQGRFKDAQRWLRTLVEKYPDYSGVTKAYWYLARMYELGGDYISAVKVYDKLLRKVPKDKKRLRLKIYLAKADALLRAREYQKAIGVFVGVLTEFKKYKALDRGKIMYRLSIAYFYNQDYAKAIESFKDAIRSSPLSPWRFKCRYMLGRTYEEAGQIQEAIDQYQRIARNRFLGDRGLKALAWESLGKIYMRLEKYEEAYEAFKNARALTTDWERLTELLRLQADALVGKGDYGPAVKLYAKYLTRLLRYYDADLKDVGGRISLKIGSKDPEAFDVIMGALLKLADTNYRMGAFKSALKMYKKIKQVYEDKGKDVPDWVLYQIGMCYKMQGNISKANVYFDAVIEKYPDSIWAKEAHWQKNEAQIRQKLDQAKELLEELKK